jgi:hypothetical protein
LLGRRRAHAGVGPHSPRGGGRHRPLKIRPGRARNTSA